MSTPRVVVIGAGAAGIGAGLALARARIPFLILEARDRAGGRAHTVEREGWALDLGCGWLHRGERNAWADLFRREGLDLDATPGPWSGPALDANFPASEQADFHRAFGALEARLARAADAQEDRPASDLLEPNGRWNALLNAFSAAYNGAAFDLISVKDYAAFDEGETNLRAPGGYGAGIVWAARHLPVGLGAAVTRIDYGGREVRVELSDGGATTCEAAIVTLPTSLLAREAVAFDPPLPAKTEAAHHLPLGCAGKVFLHLDGAERDFAPEQLLYGSTTSSRTASHHVRPFGRSVIESYFGGAAADELEAAGPDAAADFCIGQIIDALGSAIRPRLRPLAATGWSVDPWSRGAYSHALPGRTPDRDRLAEPVDGRLFFAGEACSRTAYSSAHGAYETGVRAAEEVLAGLR